MSTTVQEETSDLSALRENISRKGANSYYYAHSGKVNGPVWDGKEEPRLLAVSAAEGTPAGPSINFAKEFESFSWADGDKNVKIYIDFDKADELPDENIQLISTDSSVEFRVKSAEGKEFCLAVPELHSKIESAKVLKKKTDKFILSLRKVEEASWSQLKK